MEEYGVRQRVPKHNTLASVCATVTMETQPVAEPQSRQTGKKGKNMNCEDEVCTSTCSQIDICVHHEGQMEAAIWHIQKILYLNMAKAGRFKTCQNLSIDATSVTSGL